MFGMILSPEHLIIIALAAVVVVAAVAVAFRKDREGEDRARKMLALGGELRKIGFKHIATILENLAIKDFAGAYKECRHLAREMADPKIAAVVLSEAFYTQLTERLKADADRALIVKAVEDWKAANPPLAAAGQAAATVVGTVAKAAV